MLLGVTDAVRDVVAGALAALPMAQDRGVATAADGDDDRLGAGPGPAKAGTAGERGGEFGGGAQRG